MFRMMRFAAIVVVLLAGMIGCDGRAAYPYKSAADIPGPANAKVWEQVEVLGTDEGPFNSRGGNVANAGARKFVTYTVGGVQVRKDLDTEAEVLVEKHENPKGDVRLVIYHRRPAAE